MPAITSTTGLISGINTGALISQLISLDAAPVSLLQTRVTSDQVLGEAYQALGSQLQTLQATTQLLEKPQTFQDTAATSSDPSVLTATTSDGAAVGTYSLRVARTVSTQQLISTGFADATEAPVGAGTITIGGGPGGNLAAPTTLAELNGGAGVARGQFRITDRSGASAVIDTSSAVSLDDVVADINSTTNVSVRASVSGNRLVLTDTSGQTASNLIVQDLGTGTAAASLGLVADTASTTVTGSNLKYITRDTLLSSLNDGLGVGTAAGGGGDLVVRKKNGATYTVDLSTAKTVGDVLDLIKAGSGATEDVQGSISADGTGITLSDTTYGTLPLQVTAVNGSTAAADLGLSTGTPTGTTLVGKPVQAGIDSTLLSRLNGGSGLTLGTIQVTDSAGTAHSVDLSGASDVQGVIDALDAGTGGKVIASLTAGGTGIQLTDAAGGTSHLTVAAGTTATALGLTGTSTTGTLTGQNLDRQWVTPATATSTLNGGKGIGAGTFTITTAAGGSATVTLGSGQTTVAQVLYQINSKGVAGLTAKVNAAGDGIELVDASGGTGKLTVTDTSGTPAADLNLAGTAAAGTTTIDGGYAKTITVSATDTLTTVAAAINAADAGVTATVISDGSGTSPYRLSVTSNNAGAAGSVTFDGGTTGLGVQTLVAGQDAAVFVGGSTNASGGSAATSAQPLLITSSSDTVTNVIPSVTLNLLGVSAGPVQLTVAADADDLVSSLDAFTATYNNLSTGIASQSTYNTSSQQGGLLLGDPVALSIQTGLSSLLNTRVAGNGNYTTLYNVGFAIDSGGALTFDEDTFRAALAADPTAVEALFNGSTTAANASSGSTANTSSAATTTYTGIAYAMDKVLTQLADPVSGSVTLAQSELTSEEQGFNDQITTLNALLAQKQTVYETQFNDMESALAKLQSISSSLSGIGTLSAASSTKSSTAA